MLEKRIIDLEVKFTHQDELVYELNKIVAQQQLIIEQLQKDLREIQLSNSKNDIQSTRTLKDDIPPHY